MTTNKTTTTEASDADGAALPLPWPGGEVPAGLELVPCDGVRQLAAAVRPEARATVLESGSIVCEGRAAVTRFRLLSIRGALGLQAKGIKMSRGRTALACVRAEFGVKARTAAAAVPEFEAILVAAGVIADRATREGANNNQNRS